MITEQQMKGLYEEIAPRVTNYLVANGWKYITKARSKSEEIKNKRCYRINKSTF